MHFVDHTSQGPLPLPLLTLDGVESGLDLPLTPPPPLKPNSCKASYPLQPYELSVLESVATHWVRAHTHTYTHIGCKQAHAP